MSTTRKILLIGSFVVLNLLLITAANSIRVKKAVKMPFSLLNIPDNLPVKDLHEGLSALTTDELKILDQYIEAQSKSSMENFKKKRQEKTEQNNKNLLGAMENYWTRHIHADTLKKKRNIDDLYDEIKQENVEQDFNNNNNENYEDFSEMEALGCTCPSVPKDWNINNLRSKRENQYAANLEKGYSVEEYVRELENSFPRNQDGSEVDAAHLNHLRIKRLKNLNVKL